MTFQAQSQQLRDCLEVGFFFSIISPEKQMTNES